MPALNDLWQTPSPSSPLRLEKVSANDFIYLGLPEKLRPTLNHCKYSLSLGLSIKEYCNNQPYKPIPVWQISPHPSAASSTCNTVCWKRGRLRVDQVGFLRMAKLEDNDALPCFSWQLEPNTWHTRGGEAGKARMRPFVATVVVWGSCSQLSTAPEMQPPPPPQHKMKRNQANDTKGLTLCIQSAYTAILCTLPSDSNPLDIIRFTSE